MPVGPIVEIINLYYYYYYYCQSTLKQGEEVFSTRGFSVFPPPSTLNIVSSKKFFLFVTGGGSDAGVTNVTIFFLFLKTSLRIVFNRSRFIGNIRDDTNLNEKHTFQPCLK